MTIDEVKRDLEQILNKIVQSEPDIAAYISEVHKDYDLSARNLYRYLILRSFDLRPYHDPLSDIGVSSLRTSEGYVLSNLRNVMRILQGKMPNDIDDVQFIGYEKSMELLQAHTDKLVKGKSTSHATRIMVTLPSDAAKDVNLIKDLAQNGMEIARINLGHDDPMAWEKMVDNIHTVEKELDQPIRIYMDLAGPKIRTVNLQTKGGKSKKKLKVQLGDRILLTRKNKSVKRLTLPAVEVSIPEIIDSLKAGHFVLFDDGMIKSRVVDIHKDGVEIELTECHKAKLGSQKGINLPDTILDLPALTPSDLAAIPFVCAHADIVGYSFVRNARDVEVLYSHLCHKDNLGVVFKIENTEAFNNLPEILISGMKRNNIGVMIARGDLAVEIGFERISEVQEEILWLCQAAHIPVIWATQVLENLAKTGIPTRAEISDAAHGAQTECVMLNKGPHINKAVRMLRNILTRMESHGFKNKNKLRPLGVAKAFMNAPITQKGLSLSE